jgi:transposase-like protein
MMPLNVAKNVSTADDIEDFHRQVRNVTKAKGGFTNEMVLLKLVFMATKNID